MSKQANSQLNNDNRLIQEPRLQGLQLHIRTSFKEPRRIVAAVQCNELPSGIQKPRYDSERVERLKLMFAALSKRFNHIIKIHEDARAEPIDFSEKLITIREHIEELQCPPMSARNTNSNTIGEPDEH